VSKAKLALALGTLISTVGWAVPVGGAAHSFVQQRRQSQPTKTNIHSAPAVAPIRLREDRNAGLLVNGWINGAGPFTFAIDTGAGVSIVSRKVVTNAHLQTSQSRRPLVGGLSTAPIASNEQAVADNLSLGSSYNRVPGKPLLAVVSTLPGLIDGILDPTDLFGSLAFSIDLPNRQLLAFDAKQNGLDLSRVPADGAVVRWLRDAESDRPFVRLGDGRLALLDTGSSLGLAVNQSATSNGRNHPRRDVNDLGGGAVQSRSIAPETVSIGALVLRAVPTDMLIGVPSGTPLILGRRALFPFKITFDPVARLIAFEPTLR
jgi:Aspartyl protease